MADGPICDACKTGEHFSAVVRVIVVWAPGLTLGYPLITDDRLKVCLGCDAGFTLVGRAVDAHPVVRMAGQWTKALLVFDDGHGLQLNARRSVHATA